MTRNQKIVIAVGVIFVVLVVLVVTGVIPGLRKTQTVGSATLTVWGVYDRQSAFQEVFAAYTQQHPNIQIQYRELAPDTYERELVNALAAGRGPDLFMMHNTWLPKHYDKAYPLPETQLSITKFRELYPRVAEQDFTVGFSTAEGREARSIYALPLYIDTLALLYNKDIFDNKAVALPPKTWAETENLIPKIRAQDRNKNITLAAAAIGGSNRSINRASDLLGLLMLQTGTQMVDANFTQALFGNTGENALKFYTKFADPKNALYTWNDDLHYSLDAFAEGRVAMIFNYNYNLRSIKEKNPFLRFGIAPMLQPAGATMRVDYPNYYGLAVAASTRFPMTAWDLALFIAAQPVASQKYLVAGKHPPALRSLIAALQDDADYGVFARQALTARSWPQIDNVAVEQEFSDLIENVTHGKLDMTRALRQAQDTVTELMRAKAR